MMTMTIINHNYANTAHKFNIWFSFVQEKVKSCYCKHYEVKSCVVLPCHEVHQHSSPASSTIGKVKGEVLQTWRDKQTQTLTVLSSSILFNYFLSLSLCWRDRLRLLPCHFLSNGSQDNAILSQLPLFLPTPVTQYLLPSVQPQGTKIVTGMSISMQMSSCYK